jgi:hypothetical protein
VLLDAARGVIAPGHPYTLTGRAALPPGSPVTIERDAGTGWVAAGTVPVSAGGTFRLPVQATGTASFRALGGGEASPPVRLLVVDRSVRATAGGGRHGRPEVVRARVRPAAPGATVVLQLRLRERFGWWPVARARLDRHSRARFTLRLRRTTRARVVLTLGDGATVLARTPVLRVGPRR